MRIESNSRQLYKLIYIYSVRDLWQFYLDPLAIESFRIRRYLELFIYVLANLCLTKRDSLAHIKGASIGV